VVEKPAFVECKSGLDVVVEGLVLLVRLWLILAMSVDICTVVVVVGMEAVTVAVHTAAGFFNN